MAVRIELCLPKEMSSTVEKVDEITETTLDHVRRILSDHDYLKHPAPDEFTSEKKVLVKDGVDELHVDQRNVQSDVQDLSGACSSSNSKVERIGQVPNEGIQASDLCSLLDKFEEAIGNAPSILTPAASPGRSESWNELLSLKINSHLNETDLTPPTTPPIPEQHENKNLQNDFKSLRRKNKANKLIAKKSTMSKEKTTLKNVTDNNKKVKKLFVTSKKAKEKSVKMGYTVKQGIKLVKNNQRENNAVKRKNEDTTISFGKKCKNDEQDLRLSINCQENESVLSKTNNTGNEKSQKVLSDKNKVEKPSDKVWEDLNKTNGHSNDDVLGDANNTGDAKKIEQTNNAIKEFLNDDSSSNVSDVTKEKSKNLNSSCDEQMIDQPNHEEMSGDSRQNMTKEKVPSVSNNDDRYTEIYNNNNNEIEAKNDSCRTDKDDGPSRSGDIWETTGRRDRQCKDGYKVERRKLRHASADEDSSEEEWSNHRRSKRYSEKGYSEKHSIGKRKKYRKYSSRDDYDRRYFDERRSRKHDDYPSYHRSPWKNIRDIEHERKIDFRLGRSNIRDVAKGERRVIYVGGLSYGTTRDELWNRFRKFGPIEQVTVHLRVGERDNYGFVTFFEPEDARECIERGNEDPAEPHLDLCFGGRRQFCGGSYVDFDSTTSTIEELSEHYGKVCDDIPEEDDFDTLLRMYQEGLGR